jgi:hypothetical protein
MLRKNFAEISTKTYEKQTTTGAEQFFKPFVRGQKESAISGVGLGIALCRSIIAAHGGKIRAEPAQPAGTRFETRVLLGDSRVEQEQTPLPSNTLDYFTLLLYLFAMRDTSTAIAELSELIKEKRPPGVSISDFLSTLFETCVNQIGTNPSENEAKKIVLARGILARKELELAEGGSLSAEEFGNALGRTRQGIDYLRREGLIVAWRTTHGKWRYPAWQLTAQGGLLTGLRECLKTLNTRSEWEPIIFFLSPRESIDGKRPLDLLRVGRIEDAIAAAERHGGHGAY